jgi:hypothetical protein
MQQAFAGEMACKRELAYRVLIRHLQPFTKGSVMDFLFFFLGLAATIAALCHLKKTS